MSTNRRKTALVVGLAVTTLIVASSAWAGAQQVRVVERKASPQEIVDLQESQEAQQRAESQYRRAYSIAQDFNMRPMMRLAGLGGRAGGMATMALANAADLGLTEAQQDNIRGTQRDYRRNDIRRDADIEIAELELDEMMEVDVPDLDTIESHMRQIASLQVDERMANLRLDRAIRDILTAEQIEQLDELAPQRVIYDIQRQRNR